jgi:hypothetical protein
MKLGIMVLLLMSIPSLAQEKPQQPSSTGNAKTTGPCSPAIPGNNNRVTYNGDCLSASQLEEDQKLNTRAYEGLGEALANTAKVQSEWKAVILGCKHVFRQRAFANSPVQIQVIQEGYHFCMLDSEKTFDPKWKADRDPIAKAIDDAMGRIEANEEKNLLTPNKRNAWKNDFNQTWGTEYSAAMAKADHSPTLEDLINNDSNEERFAPLTKFLGDLSTKLGDYPSQ